MKDSIILSLNLSYDSGAAIFINGKLIAAVGEERLNRIKLTKKLPKKSIEEVLRIANVNKKDVDLVLLGSLITPNWIYLVLKVYKNKDIHDQFSKTLRYAIFEQIFVRKIGLINFESYLVKKNIKRLLRQWGIYAPITLMDHHLSHAYAAYSNAPFDDGLVITIDEMGDGVCCTTNLGGNGILKTVGSMNGFCSPGLIYSQITQLLGFTPSRHEGKITGLAAYGNPKICEHIIRKLMKFEKGRFKVQFINSKNHFIYKDLLTYKREDIAAALQYVFEDIIVEFIKGEIKLYGKQNVALAGGVFANVKLNQKIHEIKSLNQIYIYPNMGDGGLPVGAGYAFLQHKPDDISNNIFLGPSFTAKEIERSIEQSGLHFKKSEQIEKDIAELLAKDKVVARFAGRMEYGPRALGNRSILYKASDPTVNIWLNKKLNRTEFMPFAPSTLMEFAADYYKGIEGAEHTAQFMTITFDCTELGKERQPACVHLDNTARPQLVTEKYNPSFYKMIKYYYEITGIPSILNTSFNSHEEPIVCSPDDSLKAFVQADLDFLAIENFIVWKNNN
jgi:carbamoyltransferase